MVIAGLSLTVIAWVVQLYITIIRKDKAINPGFLGLYAVGCLLLAIGNFVDGNLSSGILNGLDVVLPLILLGTLVCLKRFGR